MLWTTKLVQRTSGAIWRISRELKPKNTCLIFKLELKVVKRRSWQERRGAEEGWKEEKDLIGCCRWRRILIGCCGGREEMGHLARFWRSNALNEIGFYHWLNEKVLWETECVFVARRGGQWSKVNVKVNYHHHVFNVDHLGHFLHVPRVGHLHIIAHAQCYCKVKGYKLLCLVLSFILYQTGLNAVPYALCPLSW